MQITIFDSVRDTVGQTVDISWPDLVGNFRDSSTEQPKQDLPAWSPATFDGPRSKANVDRLSAVVLDLDHIKQAELDAIFSALEDLGHYYYGHSTSSDTPEDRCWRLVLPVKRPYRAAAHDYYYKRADEALGGYADHRAKDASRCFFIPTAKAEHVSGGHRYLDEAEDPGPGQRHEWVKRQARDLPRGLSDAEVLEYFSDWLELMAGTEHDGDEVLRWYTWWQDRYASDDAIKEALFPADTEDKKTIFLVISANRLLYRRSTGGYMEIDPAQLGPLLENGVLRARGLETLRVDAKGNPKRLSIRQIIDLHSYALDGDPVIDWTIPVETVLPTESGFAKLIQPPQNRREWTPTRHEDVEQFFALLGGKNHEKLLDWLARYPDVTRPLSMLYVVGGKSTGKSTLGRILAAYWHEDVRLRIEEFFESFNERAAETMLLWDDETMPAKLGGQTASTVLRDLVSDDRAAVRRKFKSPVVVKGYRRVLLTANNFELLSAIGGQSGQDIEAFNSRLFVLSIEDPDDGFLVEFLQGLVDRGEWQDFATRRAQEHITWLAETRQLDNSRFGPVTTLDENRRVISGTTDASAAIVTWIGYFLTTPQGLAQSDDGLDGCFVKGTDLCVRAPSVAKHLPLYLRDSEAAKVSTKQVTTALRALAGSGSQVVYRSKDITARYYKIPLQALTDPLVDAGFFGTERDLYEAMKAVEAMS